MGAGDPRERRRPEPRADLEADRSIRLGSVVRYFLVEVLRSALRHGVRDEDVQHALRNSLLVEEIDEDPTRYLVLGPDRAGNPLELILLDRPQGPAVMHAMPMRAKYRALLTRRP